MPDIFTVAETAAILQAIDGAGRSGAAFRETGDLFAIRRFLQEVPEAAALVFTSRLRSIIDELSGPGYFVVKSIYFDKPGQSNWFVAYHQDLTISVREKHMVEGYGPWSAKQEQFAVQPPLTLLQDNFTIRVHLDDATKANGALRVIPGTHLHGICRAGTITDKAG